MEKNKQTESFQRLELLIGSEKIKKLKNATVAVFGLGGVGSAACDALARTAVGNFILIDFDTVKESNLNRLIIADGRDIGRKKVDVMKERILSINPQANVKCYGDFLDGELFDAIINEENVDFCIDAIDSLNPKIQVLKRLARTKIKFISSMGAGGRLNPALVKAGRLNQVENCGLATRIRSAIKKSGIFCRKIKVVYSNEQPVRPEKPLEESTRGRSRGAQASCMMVPVTFGMYLAYSAVKALCDEQDETADELAE